ncbi:Glucan endo-1,3-beta-glucosidase precursor, putative [Ricinus communis]|uniref:glucan endo-1,3-beta-D-glucosidase n=1 Tax=Ricinus communis TaxID=3988 RepID=B9SXY4_RICCO|nr:Glucan endo-1,3-beta-glucosidase precursor, putative [Ricinus communis]|eukprot:XP_002530863.1 glucan endo-1,3-beta-glucosidase [Ricinus communis]
MTTKTHHRHLLLLISTFFHLSTTIFAIGVNYGTLGNNLPPPSQVAKFIKTQTIIDSIKIFDTNPDVLRAFANTGISVTVTVGNGDIPALANINNARRWVVANIAPFYPRTRINRIVVGNEILASANKAWITNLVPAMRNIHNALLSARIRGIQVTTPNSLGILSISEPPSAGRFRNGFDRVIFAPMLQFLRETKSPFMVNPYPYFGYFPQMANYALFKRNRGIHDRFTGITYYNMYDAMLDVVYSAMKKLGYGDVGIVVGETGWPSLCDPGQPACSVENAAWFNGNLVRRDHQRRGTPLMPNRRFETFIFSLFNENLKPGPTAERNWGLFRPDFSPVYNIGIMHNGQPIGGRHGGRNRRGPRPAPRVGGGKRWCVPKTGANDQALQANINYACSQGVDCRPIQAGGACFDPNNVRSHASFIMNSFYQTHGRQDFACDFAHTGFLTSLNPSHGACRYL